MPLPTYADAFRCIGSDCEDTCCQGWTVPVDRASWDRYQSLPASPLTDKIRASLIRKADGQADFAIFKMNEANQCSLLTLDRLCSIQAELGAGLLSHACATFPRYIHEAGGIPETALALSCPEAARLVLLAPHLQTPTGPDSATEPAPFWRIRRVVMSLIRNRAYPLWQRLFLLDQLCRRLDAEPDTAFVADFEAALGGNSLAAALGRLPHRPAAQLDVVLRLAGLLLHRSNVRPRFVECIAAFTAGIGNGPGATLETLAAHYTYAQTHCLAPFFALRPHMLENFLMNTALRCQFPFGKASLNSLTPPNYTRAFSGLAAQFVLIRGLLIGVAGHHGAAFSEAHVVHTVQAASKHFEHHPEFLNLANEVLVEAHMTEPAGIAILLRDEPAAHAASHDPHPAGSAATQASAPICAPWLPGERSASAPAPAGSGRPG